MRTSSAANLSTAVKGASSGTEKTRKGSLGSLVRVTLNDTLLISSAGAVAARHARLVWKCKAGGALCCEATLCTSMAVRVCDRQAMAHVFVSGMQLGAAACCRTMPAVHGHFLATSTHRSAPILSIHLRNTMQRAQ